MSLRTNQLFLFEGRVHKHGPPIFLAIRGRWDCGDVHNFSTVESDSHARKSGNGSELSSEVDNKTKEAGY